MIILERIEPQESDNRYSIVNLTCNEFFTINRALERMYHQSAHLEYNEEYKGEADENIKTEQDFKTAFYNRTKMK